MANIFATGHGLIGSYLARQEQEDKFKRQQQALAEFVSGGDAVPAQSRQVAPAMTAPIDPQIESMPAHQRNAVVGNYTETGKKSGFLEYQPQQPVQPTLQQPPGADWINQSVAGLVKKGIPFQQAYQLASQMHQQKNAEYTQQRNNQEFPKLREGLANAIRSNDRASAVSVILQIQQMGGKVPTELIQWAAPNYQSKTNDLGDREVNSAFNPATGQYTVGQSFTKGQSPDSVARNQVAWANHGLSAARLNMDREKFELDKKNGGGNNGDTVDPAKQAKLLSEYSNFAKTIWAQEDGKTSKTPEEIAEILNNDVVMQQWAARASAAAGKNGKQRFQNDVRAIADAYGLENDGTGWKARR